MQRTYQTHEDESSVSDSRRKLARIRLPDDLKDLRVLDLGCNEGFFCAEAVRRGAKAVVGIDSSESAIAEAKARYTSPIVQFETRSWRSLPDGKFDVILWMSAMHYETDPERVFSEIASRLSPKGVFVLECGVWPGTAKQMAPIPRRIDIPTYPSSAFLEETLARYFSFRMAAPPERTPGDDIPRVVFHCRPLKPTVLILREKSERGKTTFARLVSPVATKHITLDDWMTFLANPTEKMDDFRTWLSANFDSNNLEEVYRGIDEHGHTQSYVDHIVRGVSTMDRFVVIDGFMTQLQFEKLFARLRESCVVWEGIRP